MPDCGRRLAYLIRNFDLGFSGVARGVRGVRSAPGDTPGGGDTLFNQ